MRYLSFVLAGLLMAACAPSVNPQMKSATDSIIASVKGNHTVGAPASLEPMPWKAGQWVVMRVIDKDGKPAISRLSIVAQENGGYWVETENQDYYQRSISKVFYTRMPRTAQESMDAMRTVISKTGDKPAETFDFSPDNPAAMFMKSMMKSFAPNIFFPNTPGTWDREDAAVTAGSFKGCAKVPVAFSFGPMSKNFTSWFHPGVPINGGVKGVSTDGEWKVELLDFGLTGATSKL